MAWAQVLEIDGSIVATSNLQVKAALPRGIMQMEIPDSVTGMTHKINLDTMEPEELPPAPPANPDLATLLFAALVEKGIVDAKAVDKEMLETINSVLEAAGKTVISAQ